MSRVAVVTKQNYAGANDLVGGAPWTDINTTRGDGEPDPLGGGDAANLIETAAVGEHSVYNSGSLFTIPQNTWVTLSACYYPATRNFAGFRCDGGSTFNVAALWNLTTGANTLLSVVSSGDHAIGAFVHPAAVVIPNSDPGWLRFAVSWYYRGTAGLPAYIRLLLSDNGTNTSYAGVEGAYVNVFCPQVSFANWPGDLVLGSTPSTSMRNIARGRVVA